MDKSYIFTIIDSNGQDGEGNYSGAITSNANAHLIKNDGNVTIKGGTFNQNSTDAWCVLRNYATGNIVVEDGEFCSYYYDTMANEGTITVKGGYIHSVEEECAAIFNTVDDDGNKGTLNIYGGELYSESYNAIRSFGKSVVIGDPNIGRSATRAEIKISTDSGCHTIYCQDGRFDVYYGNVSASQGSAVELLANVKSSIEGGYFESSSAYGTLYIHDGPQCDISGGTIINKNTDNKYSYPAVYFYSDTSNGTKLSVLWPKNIEYDDNNYIITGEKKHEPLLYSSGNNKLCSPIRKTHDNKTPDYSELNISGGYLISHNSAFYAQSFDDYDTMANNDFDGFYANTPTINHKASASSGYSVSLNVQGHDYSQYNASSAGDGFTINTIPSSPSTGSLFRIIKTESRGSVADYQFNNCTW